MTMKACKECGNDISTSAKKCPHCGVRNPTGSFAGMSAGSQGCLGCLGTIAVLFLIGVIGTSLPEGSSGGTTASSATSSQDGSPRSPRTRRYAHRTVNVRGGPGTDHEVVRQLSPGDDVYTGSVNDGWAPVYRSRTSNDTVGYVAVRVLERRPPPDLQLLDTEWERGRYGNAYATGRIRNNTRRTYGYVQVQINVFDAQGTQIGSTMDNVNNLGPGDVWRFRALIHEEGAVRYRIEDVTGF